MGDRKVIIIILEMLDVTMNSISGHSCRIELFNHVNKILMNHAFLYYSNDPVQNREVTYLAAGLIKHYNVKQLFAAISAA